MRIWRVFKAFIKGVMVALMVGIPMVHGVHASPSYVPPQYVKYHSSQYKENLRVAIHTGTERFLYDGTVNPDFTMTWYDVVTEKGYQVSHGEYWDDSKVRVYNNDMQYYDEEYGWIQIVAVNIDQVKEFGYGEAAVVNSSMLGSVIHIQYPDGTSEKAIVLDVCGKARTHRVVDRWVYDGRQAQAKYGQLKGIEFNFERFGF